MVRSTTRRRVITHGPLRLLPARWEALLDGRPLSLSCTQFQILYQLARRPHQALTMSEMIRLCVRRGGGAGAVRVHVYALRGKLGAYRDLIVAVQRVGYRIAGPEQLRRMQGRRRWRRS